MKKVAVVGAGNWGKNLVRNFHELDALHAVVDPSADIRASVEKAYPDVRVAAEMGEVLDSVDAVAIATPVPTHHAMATQAMRAGKDVFIEKPMTLTLPEAEEIVAAADELNLVVMTGHLLLYQPAIGFLKTYLESGDLGSIFTMHQERCKLGRARAVENVTWSFGVHDIAVLLHLIGEQPSAVTAFGHCGVQQGIEDDAYVHLDFPGGAKASLHVSWLWPEQVRRLTVIGEKGMIVFDEQQGRLTLHRKTIGPDLRNLENGGGIIFESSASPLKLELSHFLECCETRQQPLSDARNGRDVIAVLAQLESSGALANA